MRTYRPSPLRRGRTWLALPLLLGVLGGCDRAATRLADAAESTRRATEHAAADSEAASEAREAQILADAAAIAEQAAAKANPPEQSRYVMRKDLTGWAVYDRVTRQPAVMGPKVQAGLTQESAYEAFAQLRQAEVENKRLLDMRR